ncbi:MAG: tRNA pseudouridine(55) synthase TruB [Chloroflexota bacterium]|nr:tRNA pseudouridine(55) synthase TruB [Chloroflexota bacterium]
MTDPFGFLNLDKPLGMTSHDVVNRVRRIYATRQIGHAGTLDPLATGVLIVCVGAATRLSDTVMHQTKRYRALVQFGSATDTYDAEGAVTLRGDPTVTAALTPDAVTTALAAFSGDIMQVPPAYSAIKIDGRKLYDRARAGETVIAPPRAVTIHAIELIGWEASDPAAPRATIEITCGAGTYIRSIAYDLGVVLETGAHLAGLIRTASGAFTLDNAVSLDALTADPHPTRHVITPAAALIGFTSVILDSSAIASIRQGKAIAAEFVFPPDVPVFAYDADRHLIAVVEARADGRLHPSKVFPAYLDSPDES